MVPVCFGKDSKVVASFPHIWFRLNELLNGEIFYTLREAQIVIESWRRHFNTIRPHESLGYKPPAPDVFVPAFAAWPAALHRRHCMVRQMLHEHAIAMLTADHASRSRRLIKRAKDSGNYLRLSNASKMESASPLHTA